MIKRHLEEKRLLIFASIFSLIYSIIFVVGRQIYLYHDFSRLVASTSAVVSTLASIILFACILTILLYCFFVWYTKISSQASTFYIRTYNEKILSSPAKLWLINWAILFVCWLPCYLAYFPGTLSYDAPEQICIALGALPATTHQPPIHTMLLGACLDLGNIFGIEPVIIYTIIQMLIMAAVFAYYILFILKHLARKKWEFVLIYFFLAVNPIIPLMAIQTTKDVGFTCFFILCTLFIYELMTTPEQLKAYRYLLFVISFVLASLFRNNALYVLVVVGVVIIFVLKANKRVKAMMAASVVIAVVVVKIITGPVYSNLGYAKSDDKVEMSAVPMQQLGLAIIENAPDFTDDDWEKITYYMSDLQVTFERYNPRFYDPLKDAIYKTHLQEEYGGFLKLWTTMLKRYPVEYIRAFLDLNIPYWYPLADTIDPYADRVYIETDIGPSPYQFERESKIPWLLDIYENIANYSLIDKLIIRIPFAINTPIWLMLAGILLIIVKKEYNKIMVFMPSLLLWATYLLGPVSNFRYIFPIFALYPLFIGIVLHGDSTFEEPDKNE